MRGVDGAQVCDIISRRRGHTSAAVSSGDRGAHCCPSVVTVKSEKDISVLFFF